MNKPPNHRDTECNRCDNCNHAEWDNNPCLHVWRCNKHMKRTKDYMVCDDWESEQ